MATPRISQKDIYIGNLVSDKIKVRYAEVSEQTFGNSGVVVDAYYPTYVRKSITTYDDPSLSLRKNCSAISNFIASELNIYQIPFDDIMKMLEYKKQDLREMLDVVKSKKIELILVGLGGTGMNFMHWAEQLCYYTNSSNIFQSIDIFDADALDITNLFRFPQILNPASSYMLGNDSAQLKIYSIPDKTILSKKAISKNASFIGMTHLIKRGTADELATAFKNKVLYGAPTIETRELFNRFPELKFVSGTHGDNDCQLFIKPVQDSMMQIESYGMINLSVFFMNQIKLTIEFLKLLASDEDLSKSQLIMEYSFAKEYANNRIPRAGLTRSYNFPINESNFIDQEVSMIESSEPTMGEKDSEANDTIIPINEELILREYTPTQSYGQADYSVDIGNSDETAFHVFGTTAVPPPPPTQMSMNDLSEGSFITNTAVHNAMNAGVGMYSVTNASINTIETNEYVPPVPIQTTTRTLRKRRTREEIAAGLTLDQINALI